MHVLMETDTRGHMEDHMGHRVANNADKGRQYTRVHNIETQDEIHENQKQETKTLDFKTVYMCAQCEMSTMIHHIQSGWQQSLSKASQ